MTFVVVGLDGSESSRIAFHQAIAEAEWREAKVVAVHAVSYPTTVGYEFGQADLDALHSNGVALMKEELDKLAADYGGQFPVAVESEIVMGHTGVELMRMAEGHDGERAELVVVGSRGLGGFRGLLLGSVTTYLTHHLPCRLLIVRTWEDHH